MMYTRWYIVQTFDNTDDVGFKYRGITRDRCWKRSKEECERILKQWAMMDIIRDRHSTFTIEKRLVWKPGTKKAE